MLLQLAFNSHCTLPEGPAVGKIGLYHGGVIGGSGGQQLARAFEIGLKQFAVLPDHGQIGIV
jgi:hypothetical protein